MSCNVHFLGTGCMVPTQERNHLSVALEFEGDIFLFDCGEHTQLQIKRAKLHPSKITHIFLSHWHGDHVLGLPGLLMTLCNTQNSNILEIHGPKGTKEYLYHLVRSMVFDRKIKMNIHEHHPKAGELLTIVDNSQFTVKTAKVKHGVPCIGYRFDEKDTLNVDKKKAHKLGLLRNPKLSQVKEGKSIEHEGKTIEACDLTYTKKGVSFAFVFDTRPCVGVNLLAKEVDNLVIEATHLHSEHGDKAVETDHMSAKESATIARENMVGSLLLTHFSQRYKTLEKLEAEAKKEFSNVTLAHDLMSIKIR